MVISVRQVVPQVRISGTLAARNRRRPSIPNLRAAYSFNEGSGTSAADSSGNGYTLGPLAGNNPSWITGHTGSAVSVADTTGDETAIFGYSPAPDPKILGGAWTVMFWASGAVSGQERAFLAGYNPGGGNPWSNAQIVKFDAGGNTCNVQWFGHDHWNDGLVSFASGWAHIAVTFDGVSTMKVYANGSLIETVSSGLILPTNYSLGTTRFGTLGPIDDLRIYQGVLTATQISTLMGTPV